MTIQDLLKGVSVADLTTFARNIPTKADYILTKSIFPTYMLNDVKWRIRDEGRYVNTAKYRAFSASVPQASREAWQLTREGMLPPLGQRLDVDEQQQILLLDATNGANPDRLVELLYDDTERHVESIRSRLELAAGDVILDGKLSLSNENGLTIEIDFGVPAGNLPVAPKLWSDPTSDPIRDELGWIQYLEDRGAPTPELVLTSRKAVSYLATNQAYRSVYFGTASTATPPAATLNPDQVNVVRGNYGLPPITLYKAQVRVDGVATKVLPEDRWIMVPPDRSRWGQTMFGRTAESLVLGRGTNPGIFAQDAPGIVITRGVDDDPVRIWTKGAAVAAPVLHAADAHICAKVL
ncbi:major capsid protein [Embleya sp. NPDC059237]|uniref:major capsid protein n=1 Tax=Embleya sp. NPDC059237 TaxID=3346784 RepID=UPI003679C066